MTVVGSECILDTVESLLGSSAKALTYLCVVNTVFGLLGLLAKSLTQPYVLNAVELSLGSVAYPLTHPYVLNAVDSLFWFFSEEFQFRLSHTFDFTDVYPNGVSSVVYHHPHPLLLVGGSASSSLVEGGGGATVADSTALSHGISAWRVLSGLPYFKRIDDYNADGVDVRTKAQLSCIITY